MATTQVPDYIPTDGLVAWWPFNGNANDESGNGNHGLVTGATYTANRAGVSNQAILLNGTSDHITVANSASLQVTSLTFCGWINYAEAPGIGEEGMQSILSKWYRIHSCVKKATPTSRYSPAKPPPFISQRPVAYTTALLLPQMNPSLRMSGYILPKFMMRIKEAKNS